MFWRAPSLAESNEPALESELDGETELAASTEAAMMKAASRPRVGLITVSDHDAMRREGGR